MNQAMPPEILALDGPPPPPVPPSLLRRLAEAVDGFRNGREQYWLASIEPGPEGEHSIQGPFYSASEADEHLRAAGPGVTLHRFGPYRATEPAKLKLHTDLLEKIVIHYRGGERKILPGEFDALFWSSAAIEKFMYSYYVRDGIRKLQQIEEKTEMKTILMFAHRPGTQEIEISAQDPFSGEIHTFMV